MGSWSSVNDSVLYKRLNVQKIRKTVSAIKMEFDGERRYKKRYVHLHRKCAQVQNECSAISKRHCCSMVKKAGIMWS